MAANSNFSVEHVEFIWDGAVLAEQACSVWSGGGPSASPQPDVRVTAWEYGPDSFSPVSQVERTPLRGAPQQWIDHQFYAIVTDLIGASTEIIDATGRLVWQSRQSLWGSEFGPSDAQAQPLLRFPGQYRDAETGLNYNYYRYYEPETGRYQSSDPIGLAGGKNQHAYTSNPLNWLDPLGLSPCTPGTSRREAFRQAKRDAGVPNSAVPSVSRTPMTDKWGDPVLDANKQRIMTREYTYTRPDGSKVMIQDHAAGHHYPGGVGNQGPHFNVRPIENTRTGHVPGTRDHYPFGS
jgi:RHS repeat-associated protein